MALQMSCTSLIVSLILLMLCNTNSAQTGCTMAVVSLSNCLNYISGNSSTPSSSCCSRLSSVVQSQPQCLCALLKGGSSNFGIAVNQTRALALPGACHVQTPELSQCDVVNNGAAISGQPPAVSPADEIPEDPNTPSDYDTDIDSSDAGIGSRTAPRTDDSFVGGSNNGAKISVLGYVFLLASSWAIYWTRF